MNSIQEKTLRIKDLLTSIALEKDKHQEYVLVSNYFLDHFIILSAYFTNEIWIYTDGIFSPNGEGFLLEEIQTMIPRYSKSSRSEIIEKIRISTFFYENPFDLKNVIIVNNGVIDLDLLVKGDEFLIPHHPAFYSTRKLDIFFDKDKQCENINSFLEEITMNDKKFESYLIETIADCFNNHYQSQKLHLFVGDGNNGKGTFLRLLQNFLGDSNTSNLGIGLIHEASFQTFVLENCMANIVGDTNDKKVRDSGLIKKLTGEDKITVDLKHARKPISFKNKAKMFISSQFVPKVDEDNDGWYRRFLITDWKFRIDPNKKKVGFENTLQTKDEFSGLLNRVLKQFILFNSNNFIFSFDKEITPEQNRENYLVKSNPVKLFVEKFLEENQDSKILKIDLYTHFDRFRILNNLREKNQVIFGKDLKEILPNLEQRQIDRKRYYVGIELNNKWFDFSNEKKRKEIKTKQRIIDFSDQSKRITIENEIWYLLIEKQIEYTLPEIKNMLSINKNISNDKFLDGIEKLESLGKIKESKNGYYFGISFSD